MNTMKELINKAEGLGYEHNFWDAMKLDTSAESRLGNSLFSDSGAYLMPSGSEEEFRSIVAKNGTIRNLASVYKKYDGASTILAYESDAYASFVAEGGTIPGFDTAAEFTRIRVNAYKMASLAKLSMEFAMDSGFDVKKYIMQRLGRAFAKSEDKAFVNGNGTTEPTGILHATNGADTGVTATALTYDGCIDLFFSVKPEYRKNAVWLMNDNTALALRKLKDGNGSYLWNSTNDTILGKPVVICNEMPNAASGKKPIAFGDISYYWIIDRTPVSLRPIRELFADYGQVAYIGQERLDGRLIRTEAVKVMLLS